jgi:hypothetical protein
MTEQTSQLVVPRSEESSVICTVCKTEVYVMTAVTPEEIAAANRAYTLHVKQRGCK